MPRLMSWWTIEGVVAHRGVEVGELGQRLDGGPGHEGQVGEAEPLLVLEPLAVGPADLLDPLVVDLLDHQRVGRRGLGPDHVLGRAAPDVGERHDLVALAADAAPVAGGPAARTGPAAAGRPTGRRRWGARPAMLGTRAGGRRRPRSIDGLDVGPGDPAPEAGAPDRSTGRCRARRAACAPPARGPRPLGRRRSGAVAAGRRRVAARRGAGGRRPAAAAAAAAGVGGRRRAPPARRRRGGGSAAAGGVGAAGRGGGRRRRRRRGGRRRRRRRR